MALLRVACIRFVLVLAVARSSGCRTFFILGTQLPNWQLACCCGSGSPVIVASAHRTMQATRISSILNFLLLALSIFFIQVQHVSARAAGAGPFDLLNHLRGGGSSSMPQSLSDLVEETIASNRKIVVVTGGVLSGIGKGVTASSIGVLFRAMGLRVTALKIDPYLNVDAGTMSPFEHGEVFVLDDGGETDLDLGNYERFLGVCLTKNSNLSTGKIYQQVIERERIGEYLGKTVQVVPHISDAIQEWVLRVAKTPVTQVSTLADHEGESTASSAEPPEICIVELGGTLGDIESMPFVEALRQLQEHLGYKNMMFVHVSLVPVLGSPSEQKTKPTQHSVKTMMQLGLRPDFICCRGKEPLEDGTKRKLSLFTSVPENAIVSIHDVSNIYRVPLMMMQQNMPSMIAQRLRIHPYAKRRDTTLQYAAPDTVACVKDTALIKSWTKLADSVDDPESECKIAIVGKYCDQGDAYLSVVKALTHSAIATKQRLRIEWIVASDLTGEDNTKGEEAVKDAWGRLRQCDGIVVPGGFGTRGKFCKHGDSINLSHRIAHHLTYPLRVSCFTRI